MEVLLVVHLLGVIFNLRKVQSCVNHDVLLPKYLYAAIVKSLSLSSSGYSAPSDLIFNLMQSLFFGKGRGKGVASLETCPD